MMHLQDNKLIHPDGKVKLIKMLDDGTEEIKESGYVMSSFEKGKSVRVGSISSRDSWNTTAMVHFEIMDREVRFRTKSGSKYKIKYLGE